MRCSQPMGLPKEAEKFLEIYRKRRAICPTCGHEELPEPKQIGEYGMFQEFFLEEYELKDGTVAKEFIQHEFWSSGPMIWLGLQVCDLHGEVAYTIEWDKKDLEE